MASGDVAVVKPTSLLKSSGLVALLTMLSRVLGFVRDVLIAQTFGALAGVDAFFVAFKIPNFMRRLFAEGAFSQAFVPVLAESQKDDSAEATKRFIARISGNMFVVLLLITLFAVVFSPLLITVFAPGFDSESSRFVLAQSMLRITFPYLLLISMTALCGSVLNTYGYFAVPALTPVLLNLSMIIAAVYFAPYFKPPVMVLAYGVFFGGVVQLGFQLPFLWQKKLLICPKINFKDAKVRKVLTLMVPALFGVSVAQINLLLDTVFASFLPTGSVSWLYYSDRLTFFSLGVFAVAIATVILPHLSRKYASKSHQDYSLALDWGLRLVLLIALPSTVGLMMFAKPILITFLAYGKFTPFDVVMTAKSLVMFAIGLTSFMLIKVLASAFYACQNIKTPVKIGAIAMLVNTVFCLLLIGPMAHAGLALASSIAGFVNALLLLYGLLRRGIYKPNSGWLRFIVQLIFANGVLLGLLWYLRQQIIWIDALARYRAMMLTLDVLVAIVIYVIALRVSGIKWQSFKIR